jgi:uncharacterized CHY-type Zn-finger protein
MKSVPFIIQGLQLTEHLQCSHYHSDKDIVAIQFKCCQQFYACFHCHQELAGHAVIRWTNNEFQNEAILCGVCRTRITIADYLYCRFQCPHCQSLFNPGCHQHWPWYFEVDL